MKKIYIPLIVASLVAFTGCGNPRKDSLVGTWRENSDRDVVLEFHEDGGFVILAPDFPQELDNTGTWELLDYSRLILTSPNNPTISNEVTISSDSFVVVDHKAGVTMEYKRIK